jgi:hypothetical protein
VRLRAAGIAIQQEKARQNLRNWHNKMDSFREIGSMTVRAHRDIGACTQIIQTGVCRNRECMERGDLHTATAQNDTDGAI